MNKESAALSFISPVDRSTWVTMAMALRSEYGDAALDTWLDWSRGADSFREADALSVWRSCKGSGVTLGSLYHLAKQNGWVDDGQKPSQALIQARRQSTALRASLHSQEQLKAHQEAARRAEWILRQCKFERHAYLDRKGFRELEGLVYRPDDKTNLLCIPMYVGRDLAGLQLIDKEGAKRFLAGQRTSGAEYVIDNKGPNILCEGYATGLSINAAMSALKARYTIRVCFSATNMVKIAELLVPGLVVADNDTSRTGEKAAKQTEWPFWMSDVEGEDFNDLHRRLSTFKVSQILRTTLTDSHDH